ncbi:MAG TPA: ribonuclease Y [Propionibacteriaceae bacterium]|nr:ribonuclease Y [Propionibacteriaceae bacterium]
MPDLHGLRALDVLVVALLVVSVIVAAVFAVRWDRLSQKWRAYQLAAEERTGAAQSLIEAAERRMSELDKRNAEERDDIRAERDAVIRRESLVSEREARAAEAQNAVDERAARVDALEAEVRSRAAELEQAHEAAVQELERIAGLTREKALAEVMGLAEHDARLRASTIARDIEQEARATAERQASQIIVTAMQRLATDQTAASVVTAVDLPNEDMKGRIIGREGRNIRTFEQVTGVNVLIDDTPGSVLLSSFDPVRREIARVALEELIADGRIHPQRIEEAFERSRVTVDERIEAAARDALTSVGISDLHPDLVPVVGALRYRTSNGQNVLAHLVECGHLAGLIAAELGLDAAFCRRAAFLHDLGKALTHEHEGSHALVGADLARRHGEHPDIVHAIEAHHNEVEPRTVEAVLVQVVDAISGSRPGARRESLEAYVHRLERLEEIATSHKGVERAFAVQAGRDVRVMVSPSLVDDAEAAALARQIAKEISEELTFPGQIRVTVVRESRAIEIAS